MIEKSNITGLILAGGAGRRVAQRDKGLIVWKGAPLVAHVCQAIESQVGTILISCNRNTQHYQQYAPQTITDCRTGFQGPLAGIEAAATHIATEFLFIACCDMPLLSTDLVARLVAPMAKNSGASPDICYVYDGQREQYLCAALKHRCLSDISDFLDSGDRAVHAWYRKHRAIAVDFSDQAQNFINFNSIE